MWVRGHSRSMKMVPFKSLGTISYSPFIITMAVFFLAILEIFSVKKWLDFETWVWGRSRSFKMARFVVPRSYSHAAPRVWNSLPHTITDDLNISAPVFKSRLKTFLYRRSYQYQ